MFDSALNLRFAANGHVVEFVRSERCVVREAGESTAAIGISLQDSLAISLGETKGRADSLKKASRIWHLPTTAGKV